MFSSNHVLKIKYKDWLYIEDFKILVSIKWLLLLSQLSFEIIMRENELLNHLGSDWDYDLIMSDTQLLDSSKIANAKWWSAESE